MESLSHLAVSTKEDDPTQFNLTVASLLVGLDADKYIDIFKKNNIGQTALIELSDEDLRKLGVDDAEIRAKLIEEVKSLPLYEENVSDRNKLNADGLDLAEIGQIFADTSQHLYRIHLSFLANRVVLKKNKKVEDCLIFEDLYASDICMDTLDAITRTLDSMDVVFDTNLKLTEIKQKKRRKKMLVTAAGSTVIVVLAILLFNSLKKL